MDDIDIGQHKNIEYLRYTGSPLDAMVKYILKDWTKKLGKVM